MISFNIELRTLGLFLVGGIAPIFSLSDINFYRSRNPNKIDTDKRNLYNLVIPGSSVKGALRSSFTRVAYAFDMKVCNDWPSSYDDCDACYLFGAPGAGGHVYVNDFTGVSQTLSFTHVSLDDATRTTRKYSLYTAEYVLPSTVFKGRIDYDGNLKRLPPLLVAMAALRTDRIGRRGMTDLRILNADELIDTLSAELGEYMMLLKYLGSWVWDEDV